MIEGVSRQFELIDYVYHKKSPKADMYCFTWKLKCLNHSGYELNNFTICFRGKLDQYVCVCVDR